MLLEMQQNEWEGKLWHHGVKHNGLRNLKLTSITLNYLSEEKKMMPSITDTKNIKLSWKMEKKEGINQPVFPGTPDSWQYTPMYPWGYICLYFTLPRCFGSTLNTLVLH